MSTWLAILAQEAQEGGGGGIGWDPEIRGILAAAAGVAVLMGSVYLLLGTNIAWRLGFMVAAAAFFSWTAMLSLVFWLQPPGNGPIGRLPAWEVEEIVRGDLSAAALPEARAVDPSELPDPEAFGELSASEVAELNERIEPRLAGWELLPEGDGDRAEAESTVEAEVAAGDVTTPELAEGDDVIVTHVLETGGKPERRSDGVWDRVTNKVTNTVTFFDNPPRYAMVRLQPATLPEPEPGEPPPPSEPIPGVEEVSVIMVRDLGSERLPSGLATVGSLAMLAVLSLMMHRRDQIVDEHRSAPLPAPTGGSDGD